MGAHKKQLLVLFTVAAAFLMPLTVIAQETPNETGPTPLLSTFALILLIIFAIAVIVAAGLGIVGIGHSIRLHDEG
ncbi:MAG: hypothetical protein AAF490_19205 [Chloroflexota bacterium]